MLASGNKVVHSLKIKVDCLESSSCTKHVDLYWKQVILCQLRQIFYFLRKKKPHLWFNKKKKGKKQMSRLVKMVRFFRVGDISVSVKLLFPSSVSMTVQHTQDMQQPHSASL